MKVSYSYGSIMCVLLAIIADGHCDEDPELSTVPNTTTLEPDASTTLPFIGLSSAPGWWLNPAQLNNTSVGERESINETFNNENGTLHEEWTFPPLIIIRYPLEGVPELLVGTFNEENGTYVFESENGNSTGEFDINDFNVTEFPTFPVEGGIEEIVFDTANGTAVWIDFYVIPDENVTKIDNKTGEVETTVKDEKIETTILPTENISDAAEVTSLTEPQESNLPSPIAQDTEVSLPV